MVQVGGYNRTRYNPRNHKFDLENKRSMYKQTNVTNGWRSWSTFLDNCYLTFKCILTTLIMYFLLITVHFCRASEDEIWLKKCNFVEVENWCGNCTFNDSIWEKFSKDYKHQNKHHIQCPICTFFIQIRCHINAQFSWDNYAYQSIQQTPLNYTWDKQYQLYDC